MNLDMCDGEEQATAKTQLEPAEDGKRGHRLAGGQVKNLPEEKRSCLVGLAIALQRHCELAIIQHQLINLQPKAS